jgi:GNAT superfamily N-acetyltransferase
VGYAVRAMKRAEVGTAIDWAAAEGWNPGVHDADCFFAADAGGFLMGFLDDEPIASISVVRYGRAFAFLGLYIVTPEHRGRGYGIRAWSAGLEHLRGRTVGLDGVVAQQDNYRKSGFVLAHRNVRYQGMCSGGGEARPAQIVDLVSVPRESLRAYDAPFFAESRDAFLDGWIRQPRSSALGYVSDGCLRGYGVRRACRNGHKIGPLFADTPEIAERLFMALQHGLPQGDALFIDPPAVTAEAIALVERHGMVPVFETARMYLGSAPRLALDRTYGITTFELG